MNSLRRIFTNNLSNILLSKRSCTYRHNLNVFNIGWKCLNDFSDAKKQNPYPSKDADSTKPGNGALKIMG